MNLTKELLDFLADKEWHPFGQILTEIGNKVTPEKASQIFQQRHCRHKNPAQNITRPLEEQVRQGRKSAVLGSISQLHRTKRIEVRGTGFSREFRKIRDAVQSKKKAKPEPPPVATPAVAVIAPVETPPAIPLILSTQDKKDKQEEIIGYLECAELLFGEILPVGHPDLLDFAYQCRQMKKAVRATREKRS